MKLAELREDQLVHELTRDLPKAPEVRVGVGDDCAVIGRPRDRVWRLLKTDVVIEGVHFTAQDEPQRVGRKALCRALSDIAAMGGKPEHALVTLALPPALELAYVEALYRGLRSAAEEFGASIVGGETARSPGPLFINIALTGSVRRKCCVLRSGGKPKDALFVTGQLGGSRAGKHLDFIPRLREGRWLAQKFPLHAMMDLSDGLGADLPRLAQASGCGFVLKKEALPITPGASLEEALSNGEDFELLFALAPSQAGRLERNWQRTFPKLALTRIGALTPRTAPQAELPRGYDHFAQP